MKKLLVGMMGIAILLVFTYMMGPKDTLLPLEGNYPEVPDDLTKLEKYIEGKEDTVVGLKPNNHARIVWADSLRKNKTPFSFLYIHGFGASPMEGSPVHQKLAEYFGANLYLPRLPEHGIKRKNAFEYLDPEKLVNEAREAYMVSKNLGDSVIVVGTSMGGALALILASERPEIKSLLLYSPCITEFGNQLDPFFKPWTKQLMKVTMTNENGVRMVNREGEKAKYWSEEYHINAYSSLAVLLRSKMNKDTFYQVNQPLFLAYYYKDKENQDNVVSVPAMHKMFEEISTPPENKKQQAFANSGDHVIVSSITTDDWESVLEASKLFLGDVVGINSYNCQTHK